MMANMLAREEALILEKISRRGGKDDRVPLSSVLKDGDDRTRELLKKLKRQGYIRVRPPEKSAIENELDKLSLKYHGSVKALVEGKGRKGYSAARESCLLMRECISRMELERSRVKKRLKQARLRLTEAQVRERIGEHAGDSLGELTRNFKKQEALLVLLESLPTSGDAERRRGLIDNLVLQLEELDARCAVGEISPPECKRKKEAVERKRRRLKKIVSSHLVNRRLKDAQKQLSGLREKKLLTPKRYRELSVK
jgi:hypothetical protein